MGSVLIVDDIASNCRRLESLLARDSHVCRQLGDAREEFDIVGIGASAGGNGLMKNAMNRKAK
jgi:hypothetical protein